MKVAILDDYFDTLRTLACFEKLAAHDVTVSLDFGLNILRDSTTPNVNGSHSSRSTFCRRASNCLSPAAALTSCGS